MKKITFVLAGLMFSGAASAVVLDSSGPVTIVDCTLLNEDVRINLSTGVVAGVSCNDTAIALTACHTAGKTTSRTVPIVTVPATTVAPIIPEHIESCTVGVEPGCAVTAVEGAAMPVASTALGTVNTQYPGEACNSANAEANSTVFIN